MHSEVVLLKGADAITRLEPWLLGELKPLVFDLQHTLVLDRRFLPKASHPRVLDEYKALTEAWPDAAIGYTPRTLFYAKPGRGESAEAPFDVLEETILNRCGSFSLQPPSTPANSLLGSRSPRPSSFPSSPSSTSPRAASPSWQPPTRAPATAPASSTTSTNYTLRPTVDMPRL
jgi:hypothetical protein